MFKWLFKMLKRLFGLDKKTDENAPKEKQLSPKTIEYLLNDPTTPELKTIVPVPQAPPYLPFNVIGYKGGGHQLGTPAGQAASCFLTMVNSLMTAKSYCPKKTKKWPGTRTLKVIPRAGNQLNAYYDRRNLKFFYFPDRTMGKTVYTADSVDVVAHELGHALLDTIRPDLWSVQSLEAWGFHEAFADANAIILLLSSQKVVHYVLQETNGRLKRHNVVSRLAEEMGNAIYNITKGKDGRKPGALRNAINNFKYTPPERLPNSAPHNKLAGECHSFGRLFLGAWYDLLCGIYIQNVKEGRKPADALMSAKNIAGLYIFQGALHAPATRRFYNSVAKGILAFDKAKRKGKYQALIADVFAKRKILRPRIPMLAKAVEPTWQVFADTQLAVNDEVLKKPNNGGWIVRSKKVKTLRLADELKEVSAMSANPLFNLQIEVPQESYYEFNEEGKLIDHIIERENDVIEGARACLVQLQDLKEVGDDMNTMFTIRKGRLIRSYFE
jgi:hypothetical protein